MITIQTQPQLFTTLNLALFRVVSDRPTILQFKVSLIDSNTGDLMSVQKYATLPMLPGGTNFDLAPLLSAFVQPHVINNGVSVQYPTNSIKKYKLSITEIYLDLNGIQQNGDTLNTGDYYIINSNINRVDFRYFYYPNMVIGEGSYSSVFQSKRPRVSRIAYGDSEFLHFLTRHQTIIRVTYYANNGSIVTTRDTLVSGAEVAYRLDISPFFLTQPFASPFNDTFTPPFNGYNGDNLATYFKVQAFDYNNSPISEEKIYVLYEPKCNDERNQIFFLNNLGGIDSFVFDTVKQSVNSEKSSIKSNKYQYDKFGNYLDISNGVFNPDTSIIKSENTNTFSLISEVLSDEMAVYSKYIVESDNVFIKTWDNSFLPITIEQQDYVIDKSKYSTQNKRMVLTFKVNDVDFDINKRVTTTIF